MLKKLNLIVLLVCFVLMGCFVLSGCKKSTPTPTPEPTEDIVLPTAAPSYTISTSPDEKYELEVVNTDDNNKELFINDLTTSESVLVTEDMSYCGEVLWSENNRFIAIERQSTFYVDFIIVDTNDLSSVNLSIKDNFDLFSDCFPYEYPSSEAYLKVDKWLDDSILQMGFLCDTTDGIISGKFQYDAVNDTVSNFEYWEGSETKF